MLAGVYFLSWASTFLWAYMPSQMSALGWTGTQIGIFFTVVTISQALATPAWARLADRPDRNRRRLLKIQYLLAALAIVALPVAGSWSFGLVVAILIGATIRCSPPLMDTVTLGAVGLKRFGHVRAFGTAGFGAIALIFGLLGLQLDRELLATTAPWMMFGLLAAAIPLTSHLPARGSPAGTTNNSNRRRGPTTSTHRLRPLLKSPVVWAVFPVAALFAATYVPYDLFLVSLADERGFGAWLPGLALFVGVIGELLGFVSFRRLAADVAPELVIGLVVATTGAIWIATGLTLHPIIFVGLQLINGLTFAAFLLAMLEIMTRHWGARLGATAQGLLYLVVFTAGHGIGTFIAGIGYEFGSAALLFQAAGLVALVVLPLLAGALWWADRQVPAPSARDEKRRPRPSTDLHPPPCRRNEFN